MQNSKSVLTDEKYHSFFIYHQWILTSVRMYYRTSTVEHSIVHVSRDTDLDFGISELQKVACD